MTNGKAKKITCRILITSSVLVVIGFLVNWYMNHRLNSFLNQTLKQQVAEATGGFYNFSFDDFSVGFFNGELKVDGLRLKPDSAVFARWKANDSLPETYFNIDIKSIDFKGLNFKWRFTYNNLHFDVFEIKSPHIEIFNLYDSQQLSYKTEKYEEKDLYDIVSPFINVMTVKQMNLENAYISYTVEDSVAASVYKLDNVSFHAYNFRLDENSPQTGKLLYCDNFDFSANQPQTLLENRQLKFTTDYIRLDTRDSTILINNVKLSPKFSLWNVMGGIRDDYVNARIKTIAVTGINFERRNALTYLQTCTFDILSTDIHYHNQQDSKPKVEDDSDKRQKIAMADSLLRNWSLYELTSPILHSVVINKIKIGDARFKYTVRNETDVDTYTLEKFDLEAENFKVDSASNAKNRFRHADNFVLNAVGIKGEIASKNHRLQIGGLSLNTANRFFKVEDIKLKPITTWTRSDYLTGGIESINLTGMQYETGFEADLLEINHPEIRYTKKSEQKTGNNEKTPTIRYNDDSLRSDVVDLLEPFLSHLSVKGISLKKASAVFDNELTDEYYSLKDFNFYASDFLMDENTRRTKKYYFDCDSFNLIFDNFDNLSPEKGYRLKVGKGLVSGFPGRIYFENVELVPQYKKPNMTESTIYLKTAMVDINGIDYDFNTEGHDKTLTINNIYLKKPDIYISGQKRQKENIKDSTKTEKIAPFFRSIDITSIQLSEPDIKYINVTAKDSIRLQVEKFSLNGLLWIPNQTISLKKFDVVTPILSVSRTGSDILLKATDISLSSTEWNSGDNSSFNLEKVKIESPKLKYHQNTTNIADDTTTVSKQDAHGNPALYGIIGKSIGEKIQVGLIDLSDADIDYTSISGDTLKQQNINNANLLLADLKVDTQSKTFSFGDLMFSTRNFQWPVSGGFYTLTTDKIEINRSDSSLRIDDLHLIPRYPKMEFAYRHPKHKDWFDAGIKNIAVSGIDYAGYFKDDVFRIRDIQVNSPYLKNFKNQQIEIEHNVMPLIYEGLQKAPIKVDVGNIDIKNFDIIYEELAKKGTYPGIIKFTPLNGKIRGLTNVPSHRNQYIWIAADGTFMDNTPFTATWMIPADTLNDKFYIDGHVSRFDLKELNQIITPLGEAEIKNGIADDVRFKIQASSVEALIDMTFLYNNLEINIFRDVKEQTYNKFYTSMANLVVRNNNPNNPKSTPRISNQLYVERDPYHSTFNYMWQILRPASAEAVGISGRTQKTISGISVFFKKVKDFFNFGKKKKEEKPHDQNLSE